MACFLSAWNVNSKTDTNSRCENQTPNPYPSHSGRPCGQATIRLSLLHTQGDLAVKPLCKPPIPIPSPPYSALDTSDYASLPALFACTAPHNTSFERQTPSKTKRKKLQKTPRPQGNPKKTICALSLIRNRGGTLAPKAEQVLAGTKLSIPPAFSPFSKTAFLRPCTVECRPLPQRQRRPRQLCSNHRSQVRLNPAALVALLWRNREVLLGTLGKTRTQPQDTRADLRRIYLAGVLVFSF